MPAAPDRRPERILIIKPSSLGDIVHALPVLSALRAAYPQAHIAWLAGATFAPFLQGHPLLNEVIPFDRRRYGRMLQSPRILLEFWRFVRGLRRRRFDLVLDLQGLFRSGFLAWASGARRRVGFADAREIAWLFYNERVRVPAPVANAAQVAAPGQHAVDKLLGLARALHLPVEQPAFPLGLYPDELAAARATLERLHGQPLPHFVAVLPGARWPTKLWRPDRLGTVIDQLHAAGLPPCVLLGGPDERGLAEQVLAGRTAPVVDMVGRTSLRELAACLALADLILCHDSGPMHIAAALGKPLVALFGPTNPARTGPYCETARIVALPLACAPCYRRECPFGHHNCMQQLETDTVVANVREMWAAQRSHA